MTIDRDQFRKRFAALPHWLCSKCSSGHLVEDKARRIEVEPTYSKDAHSEDWWEPEFMTQRFASLLQCQNPKCGETVFITGNIFVEEGIDDEFCPCRYDVLEPRTSHPPIGIFRIDDAWPEGIKNQLTLAFSHVLNDPGAAANRLRTAVESLMDARGVKKYPRTGTRRKIDLHNRIIDFRSRNPDAADLLLAVKWLGNTGSHADVSGLDREDVIDAMELLEQALHLIYDDTPRRLARLARQINRQRGPARKRRK